MCKNNNFSLFNRRIYLIFNRLYLIVQNNVLFYKYLLRQKNVQHSFLVKIRKLYLKSHLKFKIGLKYSVYKISLTLLY